MSNLPRDKHGIRSECNGCGEVFCGMVAFDGHRRGEGDARRCLSIVALDKAGWTRCSLGRWQAPTGARRRETEGTVAEDSQVDREADLAAVRASGGNITMRNAATEL